MTRDHEREPVTIPDVRKTTQARVLLGRFGSGLPTRSAQSFLLDHARAREAVWSAVDWAALREQLGDLGLGSIEVASQAVDRENYIRRPDLGRRLSRESEKRLAAVRPDYDAVIIVADGLSASAININAAPLIQAIVARLSSRKLSIAPLVLASMARVAIGDPVASIIRARVSITLIGERPGLSAADSLGIYMTFSPEPGTPDSNRNCISNVRAGGLDVLSAADGVASMISDMLRTETSGVGLKDALVALPKPASI